MRYSDEGNLRFSGNIRASSVEPTPSQGYYREELEDGKYSITLTNSEPGLGYFGFNEDELTYDIDNHALCTKNICVNSNITSALVSTPKTCTQEIVLFDNGTCSNKIVKDANSGCIDICISGYEGESADYNFNSHGQIQGVNVVGTPYGSNTTLKFRTWDANCCLCDTVTVKPSGIDVQGTVCATNGFTSEGNALFEGNITSCGDATVTGCLNVGNNVTVGGTIDSTGNIHTSGDISSDGCIISGNNLSVSGDISATGNITAPGSIIQGLTGRFSTLCSTNNCLCYLNLGEPGNARIKDKCNTTVLGAYDGSLYLNGTCYKVAEGQYDTSCKSSIEMYGGQINIKNKNTLGETRVHLTNNDNSKGAIILENCCNGQSMGLCLLDNKARLKPVYIDPAYMELDANSISTSCACLLLKNAVCVPDIFTIGTGSSTQCHYIHTISLNGNSISSSDGTLTLGAAVTSATVNGITCTVNSSGSITLPDLTCSITVSGVTCTVDSSGSITLPNLARCVMINGVSASADATGKVDMGTLTAVLTVNSKGSAIISDSSTICPDNIYCSVVIGKNAEPTVPTVAACNNVLVGYNVKGGGCYNVAIGSTSCACENTSTAIGFGAQARCYESIAIGDSADACKRYSIALGCGAVSDGESGIAIGCEAAAGCASSIAIGTNVNNNTAGGVYIGHQATAPSNSTNFRVSNIIKTDDTAHLSIFMHNTCTSIACYCFTYKDLVEIVTDSLNSMGIISQANSGVIGHGRVSYSCDGFIGDKTVNKEMNIFMNSNAQCVQYDGTWHSSSDTTVFSSNEKMVGIWTLDLTWV